MFQIPPLETKKRKKFSVIFDEGLQILVSSEKCIWNFLFYQHLTELSQLI